MLLLPRPVSAVLAAGIAVALCSTPSRAQQAGDGSSATASAASAQAAIPDAPAPQIEIAAINNPQAAQGQSAQQPAAGSNATAGNTGEGQNAQQPAAGSAPSAGNAGQSQSTQQPAAGSNAAPAAPEGGTQNTPPQNSSSSQTQPAATQETKHQKAAEEIKEQEKQRVGGIVPSFNVSYRSDAASMSAGQKMGLAFRSAIDPYTFGISFIVAGLDETHGNVAGFGWGPGGYFERSGAAYLDAFDGTIIGNGILPSLLHQDPRYFRLGHGSFHHRLFYAIATSYICKHDNTGKWEPNYSNIGGNIISGAISNLYYPSSGFSWGQTISDGFVVTTEGTFGGVLQEFWPDISRKLFHKDPTHGLDARGSSTTAPPPPK